MHKIFRKFGRWEIDWTVLFSIFQKVMLKNMKTMKTCGKFPENTRKKLKTLSQHKSRLHESEKSLKTQMK